MKINDIFKPVDDVYYQCPSCGSSEPIGFWRSIRWIINTSPELLALVYFVFGLVLMFSICLKAINDFEGSHSMAEICQGVK